MLIIVLFFSVSCHNFISCTKLSSIYYSQHRAAHHSAMSTLKSTTSRSKPTKKKAVTFSSTSDIRFYERPVTVHANELHYSRDDISQFKTSNRQAIQDMHMRHLSSVNGTEVDARAAFQGCELTGIENLLTPGLVKITMACKRGRRTRSGKYYLFVITLLLLLLKIGTMHHVSVQASCKS